MFKFLFNLFKRKKKYIEPDYEVIQEEIGGGTMIRVEANRKLSPEEVGRIIAEQIELKRIQQRDFDNE